MRTLKKYQFEKPTIEGWDVETQDGEVFLIANSHNYKWRPSKNELLDFLFSEGTDVNFFYNLKFDFSAIGRHIIVGRERNDILPELKARIITYKEYQIRFIPYKGFVIRKNRKSKRYFDVGSFLNEGGLEKTASKLLGIHKNEDVDRTLFYDNAYVETNKDKIIKYCVQDAFITKQLGEYLLQVIHDFLGVYPLNYYSKASISKAWLEMKHPSLAYSFKQLSRIQRDFIRKSYYGGLFTLRKVGKFDRATQIDINSAYPYAMSLLPKWDTLKWTSFLPPEKLNPRKAALGFYLIKIKYDSWIQYRISKTMLIYPISQKPLRKFVALPELLYFLDSGKDFEIVTGIEAYTDSDEKEFSEFPELYEKRKELKKVGSGLQLLFKIILNATYGCLAQVKGGFTKWTNFAYASTITSFTRTQILKMKDKLGENRVISVDTDSLTVEGDVEIESSDKMGSFSIKFRNRPVERYLQGLGVDDGELKKRGFPTLQLETLITANGEEIVIPRQAPLTLSTAVIQDRLTDAAKWVNQDKRINLKSILSRYWIDERYLKFETLREKHFDLIPQLVMEDEKYVF